MIATRLVCAASFGPGHALALLLALAAIVPLVFYVIRASERDLRFAVPLAVLILAIVIALTATLDASAFPVRPCPGCLEIYPTWWCEFWYGC